MYRLLYIATLLLLSSCAAPIVMSGVAGATVSKEKSVGTTIDDNTLWARIKGAFLENHKNVDGIMSKISVEVSEGRVLLTGTLDSSDDRLKVLAIVWKQSGVREVLNEIKLKGDGESGSYKTDLWITAQVKTRLLKTKKIHSLNYNVETVDAIVYILGVSPSEEEALLVVSEAESVDKVAKVVSYINIKNKKEVVVSEFIDDSSQQKPVIEDEETVLKKAKQDRLEFVEEDEPPVLEKKKPVSKKKKKKVKPVAEDEAVNPDPMLRKKKIADTEDEPVYAIEIGQDTE
jgi:osmotically-inducible protein OsmY